MTTTLRIALLAGVLALLSNLAVIGFIYWRTSDEAATEVHQQVVEQGKVLSDVYRSGGKAALYDAIEDTISYADPQTAVALLDPRGAQQMGNLAMLPSPAAAGRLSQFLAPPSGPDHAAPKCDCHASPPDRTMDRQRPHCRGSPRASRDAGKVAAHRARRRQPARARLRRDPRPLCRAARRRHRDSRRQDRRARPQPARARIGRQGRVRPARPADQRDARPDRRPDG